jgi:hypothetical protein
VALSLKKKWWWLGWLGLNLVLGSYYAWGLMKSQKTLYLPGKTTSGHYQIELACNACHDKSFSGTETLQKSCVKCHGAELKEAKDSHPKSKFTDPRNADRVAILDARTCLTCHKEHVPKSTHTMGVTLPDDFCFYCHKKIAKDRPSHKGIAFNTCASAGCHNYHDNKALYEEFLVKHMNEPDTYKNAKVPLRNFSQVYKQHQQKLTEPVTPLTITDAKYPGSITPTTLILNQWSTTGHAKAAVNCEDCHGGPGNKARDMWTNKPNESACKNCHTLELEGFYAGKHGMRLALKLPAMQVGEARRPIDTSQKHNAIGCSSCHSAHEYNIRTAAAKSCLNCHKDKHSLAYKKSKHFTLWRKEQDGTAPAGSGVSCATCHLPRVLSKHNGKQRVVVQHNQNRNLRPNEKMIREVCMDCHGLGFSIDALADPKLIANNFQGRPAKHIKSIQMAQAREIEQAKKKRIKKQNTSKL